MLAVLALWVSALQGGCNNTNYHIITGPGIDPGSQTTEPCGETSVTVSVQVQTGGAIRIVTGQAQGSVSVTVKTPDKCIKSYTEYGADIHECQGPLQGWDCNPQGGTVTVKYFKADNPCPTLPTDLSKFLGAYRASIAGGSMTISVPCTAPKDATSTLDPSGRTRKTAKLTKCTTGMIETGVIDTRPEVFTDHGQTMLRYAGDAASFDFSQVPATARVSNELTLTGVDDLYEMLTSGSIEPLPSPLQAVRQSTGPLNWIDDMACTVTDSYTLDAAGDTIAVKRVQQLMGDLRGDGDFSLELPETVNDEAGKPVAFSTRWTRVAGNLFSAEASGLTGSILPWTNGATALAMSTQLAHTQDLIEWLNDPYGLASSDAARYESHELSPGKYQVTRHYDWSADNGVEVPLPVVALLGEVRVWTIDATGTRPRVTQIEHKYGGTTVQRVVFQRDSEVVSGTWRPAQWKIETLDASGQVVSTSQLAVTAARRPSAIPSTLEYPKPPSGIWYVLLAN